jgi:uncharacterized protein with HEPN domain
VLGEAAARLSSDTWSRFPHVQWQRPARLRNRVVHGYWPIDVEIRHTTATEQLPQLLSDPRAVLAALAVEDGEPEP